MIEEIDSATYNKHYFEKASAAPAEAGASRSCRAAPYQPPAIPVSNWKHVSAGVPATTAPHCSPSFALPIALQVYREAGSDPHAFLAAALDFLSQESAFFRQPGAADTVAQLVQRHLPAGAAAAEAPAAPAAAGVPAADAPAAAPAAAAAAQAPQPAAPAADQPQQQEEQELIEAAAEEEPGSSTLSEYNRREKSLLLAHPTTLPFKSSTPQPGSYTSLAVLPTYSPTALLSAEPNAGNGADLGRYQWTQSLGEVVVTVPVPPGTKGRACDVSIGRDRLRVGLKGQPPVLGELLVLGACLPGQLFCSCVALCADELLCCCLCCCCQGLAVSCWPSWRAGPTSTLAACLHRPPASPAPPASSAPASSAPSTSLPADGPLFAAVQPDDCLWNLVDGKVLELTLQKREGMQWWRCVVAGEPEIDVQAVEPEASKLTDLGEINGVDGG